MWYVGIQNQLTSLGEAFPPQQSTLKQRRVNMTNAHPKQRLAEVQELRSKEVLKGTRDSEREHRYTQQEKLWQAVVFQCLKDYALTLVHNPIPERTQYEYKNTKQGKVKKLYRQQVEYFCDLEYLLSESFTDVVEYASLPYENVLKLVMWITLEPTKYLEQYHYDKTA